MHLSVPGPMLDTGNLPRGIIRVFSSQGALRQERELSKHSIPQVATVVTQGSTGAVAHRRLTLLGKLPGEGMPGRRSKEDEAASSFLLWCQVSFTFLSS